MKKQYIFIIIAVFIFTSCNKNQTHDSDNQINHKNDTISSEANKKLTDRNTESDNNDMSEKIKQKIVEIDAKANHSNKVQDTILLDGIENTPVVMWYDNDKQPIKAEYGVTDDGGEFTGNFSFYFINGKLWCSDWINAKFIFDENTKLKYWLDESWKISETTETANFKEKEQMNLNTLNQLLSKVKFEYKSSNNITSNILLSRKTAKSMLNTKRILSTVGIMLFFLPFFQMCSDKSLKAKPAFFRSQSHSQNPLDENVAFEEAKKRSTSTGYELALDFEISVFSIFTIIMFLNFIIWVFTLRNFEISFLTFLNTLLTLIALTILALSIPFGQLRYGIFLFQLNSLLLFYFAFKEEKTAQ